MPRKLTDIDVQYISLVDKGANQKEIIWKAAGATEDPDMEKVLDVQKVDDEKRMVYGLVYAPGEVDSHGDTTTAKEVEKAMHTFMRNRRTQNVDKQHDCNPDEGYVAESWIVRKGDALFPDEHGAWAVGIKVEKDETWQAVKSGEISGISLYGTAQTEEVDTAEKATDKQTDESLFKQFMNRFVNGGAETGLVKDFNAELVEQQIRPALTALFDALDEAAMDPELSTAERVEAMRTAADQFTDHLDSISTAKASDSDPTDPMTDSEREELDQLKKDVDTLTDSVSTLVEKLSGEEEGSGGDEDDVEKDETEASDKVSELEERLEKLESQSRGSQSEDPDPTKKKSGDAKGIPFVPDA